MLVSSALSLWTVEADGPKSQVGSSVMLQGCCQPVLVPSGAVTVTVMSGQFGGSAAVALAQQQAGLVPEQHHSSSRKGRGHGGAQ